MRTSEQRGVDILAGGGCVALCVADMPCIHLELDDACVFEAGCYLGEVFHGGAQLEVSGFVQGIESVTGLARVERVELA